MENKFNENTAHNLIWVDLEMTGLHPDQDHILEIAIVITDQNLNIIADDFDLIIKQSTENLALMDDWVRDTHSKNGLLNLVRDSHIDLNMAEIKALEFVKQHVLKQTSPICGNSICLDRRFLFRHMPKLEQYFHYRNLDVSTVKNLGLYWFPEKVKNLNKTEGAHRAKDDILQSIAELKFYRDNLFCKF
jgi:oligoribonuclease